MRFPLMIFAMLGVLAGASAIAAEPVDADVLLRGGTLYLGDGSPGLPGDVAIRDKVIVAVGQFKIGQVNRIVDCTGLCVAPGFIDLHTHSDDQVVSPDLRACVNYVIQGCTTSVTGNCGSGPTDVEAFYAKIDAAGAGTNVAHLLPQGSLREKVLNRRLGAWAARYSSHGPGRVIAVSGRIACRIVVVLWVAEAVLYSWCSHECLQGNR